MTADERRAFDLLIEALRTGEASEFEFRDVSSALGASAEQIETAVRELRLEDGILS